MPFHSAGDPVVCHSERSEESACNVGKNYYVYILASRSRNLYTGVTSNLQRRVVEHRQGMIHGFTRRYRIHRLVYFEVFGDIRAAIQWEEQIKSWRRGKKVALIQKRNPAWDDLVGQWFEPGRKAEADPSLRSG